MHAQQNGEHVPAANPGRPTVSTPATLTPVGYQQFESGAIYAQHSGEFDTRFETDEVLKLAVNRRLEGLWLTEPVIKSTQSASPAAQPGELFAGAQAVLIPGDNCHPTFAVSYFYRNHASPAPELDMGTYRQSAILMFSTDAIGFHGDLNGMFNEQIADITGVRRLQYGQTLSISHPLRQRWIISGEIWHFSQPLLSANADGNLWAASYVLRPNLVLDAAYEHGLTTSSTHWETLLGFTYLLPKRLWE